VREIERAYVLHKDGYRKPVSLRIVPIFDDKDKIIGCAEIIKNLSVDAILETMFEHLERLAMFDPITEMPNKEYIERDIHARLAEVRRRGRKLGLLMIKIDDFVRINGNYGKDTGNRVLRMFGTVLRNTLRPFDTIGRWRDENFATIILDVDEEQLAIVAERLLSLITRATVTVGKNTIMGTISIGGTMAKNTDKVDTLIKRAYGLMQDASRSGGNRINISSEEQPEDEYEISQKT